MWNVEESHKLSFCIMCHWRNDGANGVLGKLMCKNFVPSRGEYEKRHKYEMQDARNDNICFGSVNWMNC